MSKDINLQQIRIDGQVQQNRPVTRENQRTGVLQVSSVDDGPSQANASAQQIKSAIQMNPSNRHRKLNNQYFSRQS